MAVGGEALAQAGTPSARPSSFDYPSVQEALDALKAKPGVQIQITKPDAWTIVNEPGNIQWSFAPSGHYAHPAVVKREIKVNSGGDVYIEMSGLCQAEKASCDRLMDEFKELNERIRQSIKARVEKK
jgi:hypothetical protein